MKIKAKLISLIAVFVLLAGVLVVGVYAAFNMNFRAGGSIEFKTKAVNATVEYVDSSLSNLSLKNGQTVGTGASTDIMKDLTITTAMADASEAENINTWSNIKFAYNNAGNSEISFQIKVTNNNKTQTDYKSNNYLDVTAQVENSVSDNVSVYVYNIDSTKGITDLVAPEESSTFKIIFKVKDLSDSGTLEGFKVKFNLEKVLYSEIVEDTNAMAELVNYTCTDNTASISGKSNLTETLVLPKWIISTNDASVICRVSKINSGAFSYKTINGIILPDTMTTLDGAFSFCSGLTEIHLPASVTSLSSSSTSTFLYALSSMTKITVAEGNMYYEDRGLNCIVECATDTVIAGCKNSTLNDSIKAISNQAFYGCSGLTSITIPNSVTSLNGFYGTGLQTIKIPGSVKTIGEQCFFACADLTTVECEAGITQLPSNVFGNCPNLSKVILPETLESVNGAFNNNNTNLTELRIPSLVTTVTGYFPANLKTVYIDSPTIASSITASTSSGSLIANATDVYINDRISSVGSYITSNYTDIPTESTDYVLYKNITVSDYTTYTGYLTFEFDEETRSAVVDGKKTDASYPSTELTIPAYVKYNSVAYAITETKASSFFCSSSYTGILSLTKVILPDTIKTIGTYSFGVGSEVSNSFITLEIGSGIESIGADALTRVSHLICKAKTPPTVVGTNVSGLYGGATIKVPAGCISAYASAWGQVEMRFSEIS